MDETIMKFEQEWGEILNLSFRTDGIPYLVSSSKLGHVAIWDLENRRLHKQMRDVHKGPVTGCEFVRNEALLVTSSLDNKLKIWRFDELNDNGVILHLREGHSLPPTKIRFYSESGHQIISSSLDCTLRNFSIYSERLHKNLGTATTNRKLAKRLGSDKDPYKLSPITDFAFEIIREKEFDNIVTLHKKTLEAISWSGDKCRIGSNKFVHKRFRNVYGIEATAVTMSSCGNFVCIGYTSGHIDKFNIQSGLHRSTFVTEEHVQKTLQFESENQITGLAIDDISTKLVSTNSSFIKFWNFKTSKIIHHLNLGKIIKKIHINRQTGLIAVSFEEDEINIIDLDTKNLIREFKDLNSKINDIVFSSDSKWIIVAFEDKSIRVFDLESAAKIDHFLLSSPCISLSISPNNEFLATSHPDQNGIFLWSNINLYVPKLLHKLKNDFQPKLLDLPVARPDEIIEDEDLEDGHTEIFDENSKQENNEKDFIHYKSPEQLSKELITLSNLPSSPKPVRKYCSDDNTAEDYIVNKMIKGYASEVLDLACQGYDFAGEIIKPSTEGFSQKEGKQTGFLPDQLPSHPHIRFDEDVI
ncbi:hypothetical protein RND71_043874 [Anisodus tanguticus]|uniref:WDR36/Utp21 N-terminal domain-containing protein n=1 Tax=Anisodus tanguticus TaxID=243964 RepID=A0AAE1UNL9_9SOLA|nr:hypothetical protein RND71_043874 [Anisodus tanguticus]